MKQCMMVTLIKTITNHIMQAPQESETEGDEPEGSETEDDETFMGRSLTLVGGGLEHSISITYKLDQLFGGICPDMYCMLESHGFDKVDGWQLLISVAAGGKMTLRGPMFENKPRYDPKTMRCSQCSKSKLISAAI